MLNNDSPALPIVCHDCALPVSVPVLRHRQKASCPRCGLQLSVYHRHAIDYVLAYALAALIFLAVSLQFNFLSFSANGQQRSIDLEQAIASLLQHDYLLLALIALLAIFVVPAVILAAAVYVLLPWRLTGKLPASSLPIFKLMFTLIPWGMAEIFLIGALVSLIKISSLADISLGLSFYAYCCFALCTVLTVNYLDHYQLHRTLRLRSRAKTYSANSPQHCWALLLTSVLLYIPASSLPIMTTRVLGKDQPSTIMGGVKLLWEHGSYPIALIIFFASVFVPLAKILVLIFLNYSVQAKSSALNPQRMRLYRITEFIGRWSMIDVFVVALLVGLIQLGNTMSIYPGPAALAFSALVVTTMLAARVFDPQLIWQPRKHE